jgi:nucleotide-binding universal stress UspA family protein
MLPLYKKILIAIDFSDYSTQAFKNAVMLARQNDAEIHVLHVIHSLPQIDSHFKELLSRHLGTEKYEDFEQNRRSALLKELSVFTKEKLADFPEDMKRVTCTEVLFGNPAKTILEYSDQNDIDVIIVGSHGRDIIERTIIGSVAEKVLRKSTKPVFVIPLQS